MSQSFFAVTTILFTSFLGAQQAFAQSVEPTFPLPNSQNSTVNTPIDLRLTEQPKIKLNTIKILVNGVVVNGNLSVDTSNLSLRFQGTPSSYNIGQNTVQVEFENQAGIRSQFTWPFTIGAATATPTPQPTPTTPTTPVALKPEFTRQTISGNTLILEGKTQAGSNMSVNIVATRPASSVGLGPIIITTGNVQQRQMSATGTANPDGTFRFEFNVINDPKGTQYDVEATARQGNQQEVTTLVLKR
jgi:hypothetical protein